MHNDFDWYQDTQYLCLYICDPQIFVPGFQDTEYSRRVSTIHKICLVFIIHNINVWYPWYRIFMLGIHDTHCLWPVSMTQNIYVWYIWYTLLISMVSIIHIFYVWYPWCTLFVFGIPYKHCFSLVFMIGNIYDWIKSLILCIVDHVPYNVFLSY